METTVLFNILAVCFTFFSIFMIDTFLGLFPSLLGCIIRFKENLNLEGSMKLSRDRNVLALFFIVPFCLLVFRYSLWAPSLLRNLSDDLRLLCIIGAFLAYLLLRGLLEYILHPGQMRKQNWQAAVRCSYTFFLIAVLLSLFTAGCCSMFHADDALVKSIIYYVLAATYFIYLIRKTQIFVNSCHFFSAILYLCALEILPTGLLVASTIVF